MISITSFKVKMIHSLESNIKLPAKGYFVKNENSIRIAYYSDKLKYINLPTRLDAAIFLKDARIIDEYSNENGLSMFQKEIVTKVVNGSINMNEKFKLVSWDDLDLTTHQVLTIAARHEYNLAGMGKIINLKRA